MFIPALFPIVQMWEQPKCPSANEEINKRVVLPYNRVLF